jgi:hypothetical protein
MHFKIRFKKIVWMVAVGFLIAATAQAYQVAQIMPQGKVNVYRDGKLVQVLTQNAPLPSGALLKNEGYCGVRLKNVQLVAEGGSQFGVNEDKSSVELAVVNGKVFFAVNQETGDVVFHTPDGIVSVQQFLIQAADDGIMKGFIDVSEGELTLGVLEGGSMLVSTARGDFRINSGEQLILSQADIAHGGAGQPSSPSEPKIKKIPTGYLVAGGIAALAVGGILIGSGSSSGQSNPPVPVSPATP